MFLACTSCTACFMEAVHIYRINLYYSHELSASHRSILSVPIIVTDSAPSIATAHFNSSFIDTTSSNQSDNQSIINGRLSVAHCLSLETLVTTCTKHCQHSGLLWLYTLWLCSKCECIGSFQWCTDIPWSYHYSAH